MTNRRRGEAAVELGGRRYRLCLTLGGLAELEEAFGAEDVSALTARFATGALSSRDLLKLLAVGLRIRFDRFGYESECHGGRSHTTV